MSLIRASSELATTRLTFLWLTSDVSNQIQIPSGTKHPKNWTRMSSTKDFDRYYSPEGITMVAELKEARERLKGVLNGFLARVRLLLISVHLDIDLPATQS